MSAGTYARCVRAGQCPTPGKGGHCTFVDPARRARPITCVDWNGARAFCAWIGRRLPSDEEWIRALSVTTSQRETGAPTADLRAETWEWAQSDGEVRVAHGGRWGYGDPDDVSAAYRDWGDGEGRGHLLIFRCAQSLPDGARARGAHPRH